MHTKTASRTASRVSAAVIVIAGAISVELVRRELDPARAVIAAANALDVRLVEARFAERLEHRPYRTTARLNAPSQRIREAALELRKRWESGGSSETGRFAAAAFLLTGNDDRAFEILEELLRRGTAQSDITTLIRKSTDPDLLIDFSAAALQRPGDQRSLLLAYEAADRAWQLARAPSAAWNRALAADRIGMPAFAASAWEEVAAQEPSSNWACEARARASEAVRRAAIPAGPSVELSFLRGIVESAVAGEPLTDRVSGDHLASDTAASLARLRPSERRRAVAAMTSYLRGRTAFENNDFDAARAEFASAEAELGALDVALVVLARDQRIRCECSRGKPGCLDAMRAFRSEIAGLRRYAWLAARAAYGEGQALYRQGRVYEAAEQLQQALTAFEQLGDHSSAGFMRVLLANVFGAAGESELALAYHLDALAQRSQHIGDRRRKQLEDAMLFMLRHGYLSTTELLLGELAAAPASDAAHVMEEMLRGIIAFRRGDPHAASLHFERAHTLLSAIQDAAARADVQFRLAIAESGSRRLSPRPILNELDSAVAAHERTEFSVWLPQLLTERGAAFQSMNDLARAESDYRRAIGILEQREPRIDETVLALGVVSEVESPFDLAIRLLLRQGRIAGALSIAQRSTALRISSLHARGAGVRDAFRGVRGGGDGIAALRSRLRPREIAVAHHLLRDELITWIVTADEIRATRRLVSSAELSHRIDRLRECAARPGCKDEEAVDAISAVLLRDWIDRIPPGATLLMQPPAELQAVPFSMLKTRRGERLVTRNSVATAPSFRAFARALRIDAERSGVISAFLAAAPRPGPGLEPLPLTMSETARASRSYAQPRVETHATRARFLELSPSFSVIHFAGHVVVNAPRPLFSALVFENGELLYVHELDERSFTNARLVVLSGCETGRSPRPTMSVANALLSQSVPSAVYTLWPVSDDAAEAFAVAFHRAVAAGMTRADAVRDAQLSLFQVHPDEPNGWAAFALAGAPGPLTAAERKGEEPWQNSGSSSMASSQSDRPIPRKSR